MGFGAQAQVSKTEQNKAQTFVPKSCSCAEWLRALISGLISVLLGTERELTLASGLSHTGKHVGLRSRKPDCPPPPRRDMDSPRADGPVGSEVERAWGCSKEA